MKQEIQTYYELGTHTHKRNGSDDHLLFTVMINARYLYLKAKYHRQELMDDLAAYLQTGYLPTMDFVEIIHQILLDMKLDRLVAMYENLPWEMQTMYHRHLARKRKAIYWEYSHKIRMEKFDQYQALGHYHE